MNILIVDDDPMTLKMIEQHLSTEGYTVTTAMDGYNALEKIESAKFDLIITDVMMPNLSGLSLLSLLKSFYFNKTPIILISSLDKLDVILQSLGLGIQNFIIKPIDLTDLSNRIKYLVSPAI